MGGNGKEDVKHLMQADNFSAALQEPWHIAPSTLPAERLNRMHLQPGCSIGCVNTLLHQGSLAISSALAWHQQCRIKEVRRHIMSHLLVAAVLYAAGPPQLSHSLNS